MSGLFFSIFDFHMYSYNTNYIFQQFFYISQPRYIYRAFFLQTILVTAIFYFHPAV